MEPLTGALVAAGAAWLSILAAAALPVPRVAFDRLRWVGSASIALLGAIAVGVPLPPLLPAAVLAGGAVVVGASSVRRRGKPR